MALMITIGDASTAKGVLGWVSVDVIFLRETTVFVVMGSVSTGGPQCLAFDSSSASFSWDWPLT